MVSKKIFPISIFCCLLSLPVIGQNVDTAPSIPRIQLTPEIAVRWNVASQAVQHDDLFDSLRQRVKNRKHLSALIAAINDTTLLPFSSCAKKTNLRVGDIAYMALDQIKHIAVWRDLGFQCDVFTGNCHYCDFMFDAFEHNRYEMERKVRRVFGFKR